MTTVDEFREAKRGGCGFIVITDIAKPIRLHRADCSSLKEANFKTKVVINGMRTGDYFAVAEREVAHEAWPRLEEHGCVRV